MHLYSYNEDRIRAFALLVVVSIVTAIGMNAIAEKLGLGPPWLVSAPTVGASFAFYYALLDRVAWRLPPLRWVSVVDTPRVFGRYKGKLTSSYQSTEVDISIEIEQTWTHLIVKFDTGNGSGASDSRSMTATIVRIGRHESRLTYTYRNEIRPGIAADDMSDHDGTAQLVFDDRTFMVTGKYYNFRQRVGRIELQRVH